MGKFKSWKYRGLFTNIATSVCLLGASAGLIFGVSAGTFKVQYQNLNSSEARVEAANGNYNYYSQDIKSAWNMAKNNPNSQTVDDAWWNRVHKNAPKLINDQLATSMQTNKEFGADIDNSAKEARYKYASMVIDGSTHTTMDRSFNQGLYNGIVNFIQNKIINSNDLKPETETNPLNNCAKSFKPGADNTTEFINIFSTVAKNYKVVGLAGFNHVTPLIALGKYNDESGLVDFTNPDFNGVGFLLIDGDVSNNQSISSVLFRSDQPGFMVGLATSMYFYNNLGTYHNNYQDLSIGAYGGTSIPTVTIYMGGVQRGLEFFNKFILLDNLLNKELHDIVVSKQEKADVNYKDIKNLCEHSKYKDEINTLISKQNVTAAEFKAIVDKLYDEYSVKMIKLGESGTHFSGTFAAGDAIGITKQYLNRGASAIIAVAGPQSLDTAQEIQNQKSNCIVIGVDSAMEEGDYQRKYTNGNSDKTVAPDNTTPAQKGNIIKFSAVKDMTSVTRKFASLCAQDKNFDVEDDSNPGQPDPKRSICGIGYKTCGNITNGLISISWDGWYPFVQALSHISEFKLKDAAGQVQTMTFANAWKYYSEEYLKIHKDIPQDFASKVTNIENLKTYNKDAFDGCIYKNYNILMSILGEFFNYATLTFPKDMTVKAVPSTVEGKTVVHYEAETEDKTITVLEWLQKNMYFTN